MTVFFSQFYFDRRNLNWMELFSTDSDTQFSYFREPEHGVAYAKCIYLRVCLGCEKTRSLFSRQQWYFQNFFRECGEGHSIVRKKISEIAHVRKKVKNIVKVNNVSRWLRKGRLRVENDRFSAKCYRLIIRYFKIKVSRHVC